MKRCKNYYPQNNYMKNRFYYYLKKSVKSNYAFLNSRRDKFYTHATPRENSWGVQEVNYMGDIPMNSNASSKYCLRLACPLSRADRRLYCTPGARWSTDGDGDCWLVVTFNTRVTPIAVIPSRSSASLLLPRYKKGRTLVSGWESIISQAMSDGQLNGAGNNEFSHMSLWRKWNSLWPPGEKQFNRQRSEKIKRTNVSNIIVLRIIYFTWFVVLYF